jgi:hypothetical protein
MVSGNAHADGGFRVQLQYDATALTSCPSKAEFRGKVAELLGYDPFVAEASRTVSIRISETPKGLLGLLQWRASDGALQGERHFDDPDCRKLAQNIAFAVTVQIQLLNSPRQPPAAPAPEEEATPARAQHQPTPEPRSSQPRSEKHSTQIEPTRPDPPASKQFELGAGTGPFVVFGWSPKATLGGSFFLVGRNDMLSTQLGIETSLSTRVERGDGSGFVTSILAGSASLCLRFHAAEACPVFRVGRVRVRGFGVDEPRSPSGLFSQAGLRLSLARQVWGSLEARGHGEAVGTLSAWRVQLNENDAFSSPPFSFLLGLDLVAYFL